MSRLIMHVDLDAFFAAIEQRDNPQWLGLPLVVGAAPGRRGVVATCSYEARRFGVHSAMPISEAARRLPPETIYVRPSMDRYARVSREIMEVLSTVSPLVEKVSIDEAYLARHEHRKGLVVTLKIRFHPFETHTRSRTLSTPTASDVDIFRAAWALFQSEPPAGRAVRLIGVGISGWDTADSEAQQDLFDGNMPNSNPEQEQEQEQERIDETLDAIRHKFGRGTIRRGLLRRPSG